MHVFHSSLSTRCLAAGVLALAFCPVTLGKAKGAEIVLHSLVCIRPANGGVDQVALTVKPDGRNATAWRQYLRANDAWNMNNSVLFAGTVDVSLTAKRSKFGIDKLMKDRHHGSFRLGLRYGAGQHFDFQQGGAWYRLNFSVNPR
jgi:hypothetical protein